MKSIVDSNRCYDSQAIRKIEELAFKNIHVNDLMERAGLGVFQYIKNHYHQGSILIFCGPGNNGGDGYVVARLAYENGYQVSAVFISDPDKLPPPALHAYKKCQKAGVNIVKFDKSNFYKADLIIDGLMGIGLARNIDGDLFDVISIINTSNCPVISIDVPSGIHSDTGSIMGIAVKAKTTVTFIGKKIGLLTNDAIDYVGELILDSLDLSDDIFSTVECCGRILHQVDLAKKLMPRNSNTHKGNYGHVVIVGGDQGMAGAVVMSAYAALRTGAGRVSVITHEEHATSLFSKIPEVMVHTVDSYFLEHFSDADVVIFGPGMGESAWSRKVWDNFIYKKPLVLDAGGLRLLSHYPKQDLNCILTPHPGEAADLLKTDNTSIQANRYNAAREIAKNYQATVVLKGAGSIICDTNSKFYISTYGNPGMATAGMGDVLSGVIGALIANGCTNILAAKLGVLIHALAGDLAAQKKPKGLMAMDLMEHIRELVNIQ